MTREERNTCILLLKKAGVPYRQIAELLGCSKNTVVLVVNPVSRERSNARRLQDYYDTKADPVAHEALLWKRRQYRKRNGHKRHEYYLAWKARQAAKAEARP